MLEDLKSEVSQSWESSGIVLIDKVGFVKPDKALYMFGSGKYVEGAAPKGQVGIEEAVMDALRGFDNLYAILMSPQDFKAYNDGCVAKEKIKL